MNTGFILFFFVEKITLLNQMVQKLSRPSPDFLKGLKSILQGDHPSLKQLEQDINIFYMNQRQSQSMLEERKLYVALVRKYLKSEGVTKQLASQGIKLRGLSVFGSFPTHCASKDSDLDLCVCATATGNKKQLPVIILQAIFRDMMYSKEGQNIFGENVVSGISFVQTAKVPIIRFKINDVPVDLSATFDDNPRTSLAAKYINAYCQLDDRFKILVMFLKKWMKSEGRAEDHLRIYPNSYSIILLLIHVLQWYDILPNLHQTHSDLFHRGNFKLSDLAELRHEFKFPLDENTISMHRKRPSNDLTVVQLLYLFACQYSNHVVLLNYRFNMRNGEIEALSQKDQDYQITILDAYDVRNPGRSARNALDLVKTLEALKSLLVQPHEGMFKTVMEITRNRTYERVVPPPQVLYQDYDMQFGADPYNMPLVGSVEYQQWLEQVAMHHQIQMMQGQMMQQQIVFTAPEMYYYSQQQQQPHPIFGIQQSSQFF